MKTRIQYFTPAQHADLAFVVNHMRTVQNGRYADTVHVRQYGRGRAIQWYDCGCYWPEEPPNESPYSPPVKTGVM